MNVIARAGMASSISRWRSIQQDPTGTQQGIPMGGMLGTTLEPAPTGPVSPGGSYFMDEGPEAIHAPLAGIGDSPSATEATPTTDAAPPPLPPEMPSPSRPEPPPLPTMQSTTLLAESQEVAGPVDDNGSGVSYAKRAAIASLIPEGTDAESAAIVARGLSVYSLENLQLLQAHDVQFQVGHPQDMPEVAGIRNYFMESHEEALDQSVRWVTQQMGMQLDPSRLDRTTKLNFLRDLVKNGLELSAPSEDFGTAFHVGPTNVDDLEHMCTTRGSCISAINNDTGEILGMGVFLIQNSLTEGIVIHEAAHALDTVKDLDLPRRQGPDAHRSDMRSLEDESVANHQQRMQAESQANPALRWSEYAFNSSPKEYVAEAVRVYAQEPERLKAADPRLFEFAREFVESPAFPSLQEPRVEGR